MTAGAGSPHRDGSDRGAPDADEVRAQLGRILGDPSYPAGARRRALLRYLVDETLAGRAERLKGFSIAVEVFGRSADFDPQVDPVVRLEARRLRSDLDAYYMGPGRHDPILIGIPKGAYVPRFDRNGTAPAAQPPAPPADDRESVHEADGPSAAAPAPAAARRAPRGALRAALLLCAAAAAGTLLLRAREPVPAAGGAPTVIVLPFETLGGGEEGRLLAAGLSEDLIVELMRYPDLRLYSVGASFRQDPAAEPSALGRALGVDFVVHGSLRVQSGEVRIVAHLDDMRTGEMVWSESFESPLVPAQLLAAESDLAERVAVALGQPYGAVNRAAARDLEAEASDDMSTYACVLRAYAWRRAFNAPLFARAFACLQETVRVDPDSADAWAMLGWLHLDAARMGMVDAADAPAEMEAALRATKRAVEIDRTSPRALQALAAVQFYRGAFDESERLQREALALNPYDPETLAQLGWRLAARGRAEEGLAYLREAIDRTIDPPGWYFHLIAVHAYLDGDYRAAIDAAERSTGSGSGLAWSIVAMSEAKLGDMAAAEAALGTMAEVSPQLARDPAAFYQTHGGTEAIVAALVDGLRAAGWRAPPASDGEEQN